jgi:hypothetical protein
MSYSRTFTRIDSIPPTKGTNDPRDMDVVIVVPCTSAMFGRQMFNKETGEEIPFGTYPNIDWT